MSSTSEKNNAFLLQLSSFSGYFFPFGGIIVPLIFWELTKRDSEFLDATGKEVINFNLSFLLYSVILIFGIVFSVIPIIIGEYTGLYIFLAAGLGSFFLILIVLKLILIIIAAVKSNQGEVYRYPLTIRFIK